MSVDLLLIALLLGSGDAPQTHAAPAKTEAAAGQKPHTTAPAPAGAHAPEPKKAAAGAEAHAAPGKAAEPHATATAPTPAPAPSQKAAAVATHGPASGARSDVAKLAADLKAAGVSSAAHADKPAAPSSPKPTPSRFVSRPRLMPRPAVRPLAPKYQVRWPSFEERWHVAWPEPHERLELRWPE